MRAVISSKSVNLSNAVSCGRTLFIVAVLSLLALTASRPARAGRPYIAPPDKAATGKTAPLAVEGEILVKFKDRVSTRVRRAAHMSAGAQLIHQFRTIENLQVVRVKPGKSDADVIAAYLRRPAVEHAEPNYVVHALDIPNDRYLGKQWALHNTGRARGVPDADIDAPEAWDMATGSEDVVVVVIDTGIDYTHQDLAANIFVNSADCNGDGRDDDGNGHADDRRLCTPRNPRGTCPG